MAEINWRFDINIASVSQTAKCFLASRLRLREDALLTMEQIVGVVVFAAQDYIERVFGWSKMTKIFFDIQNQAMNPKVSHLTFTKFACLLAELSVLWWKSLMWGSRSSCHNFSFFSSPLEGSGKPLPLKKPSCSIKGWKLSFLICLIDIFIECSGKTLTDDWSYLPETVKLF